MAKVKVFVPTYRRNDTLPRSIESLLKQTFTNWVCEVHNDEPGNNFPSKYIAALNDDRFTVINHENNLGPTLTFNLAFDNCSEEYVSLLEDDNWWEPAFLETMVGAMSSHSHVQVAWANMNFWQEEPGNKWVDMGKTIWPLVNGEVKLFHFPNFKQAITAIHSNGAMLVRNKDLQDLKTPENTRFDFAETIRERAYRHPLLLINKPLANFSLTINTSRGRNVKGMYEHQLLLIDSFFTCVKPNDAYARQLWDDARQSNLHTYLKFIYTGLICKESRKLLAYASAKEWLFFFLYNIKHPSIFSGCIKAKKTYSELWDYLLFNTKKRVIENRDN